MAAEKFAFQVFGTDKNGEFLRCHESEITEKEAYLKCGDWKNATHFRLLRLDGSLWKEWGVSRERRTVAPSESVRTCSDPRHPQPCVADCEAFAPSEPMRQDSHCMACGSKMLVFHGLEAVAPNLLAGLVTLADKQLSSEWRKLRDDQLPSWFVPIRATILCAEAK